MGFFDFLKRDTEIYSRLEKVQKATHSGFSNVKRDIGALSGWVAFLQKSDQEKTQRLEQIERKLQNIINQLEDLEFEETPQLTHAATNHLPEPTQDHAAEVVAHFDILKKLESLTLQQRNLFNVLCRISMESGNDWKSMMDVAQDVYGDRPYSQVRTTLSAYTARLEELSLVERTRKGRFVYMRLAPAVIEGLKKGKVKLVGELPA